MNLLDNSDFRAGRVVNQRGQSDYSGLWTPAISRWYIASDTSDHSTLSMASGGIALNNASGLARLVQRIPPYVIDARSSYTAAYCDSDGKIVIGAQLENHVDQSGFWQLVYAIPKGTTLRWAALYEGAYTAETLPPYLYKGYAAELAECQRYLFVPESTGVDTLLGLGVCTTATLCRCAMSLPAPLRGGAAPSIQCTPSDFRLITENGTLSSITAVDIHGASRGSNIMLRLTGTFTLGQCGYVYVSNGGKCILSMEL